MRASYHEITGRRSTETGFVDQMTHVLVAIAGAGSGGGGKSPIPEEAAAAAGGGLRSAGN